MKLYSQFEYNLISTIVELLFDGVKIKRGFVFKKNLRLMLFTYSKIEITFTEKHNI